ncbi:OmpA family protein [Dinoroseobacter sp. PD6]|uniref:OmpA family protein n=1 Tax=Dinoroseobacter sp. PD6 TaxID=3028384 RepID=UPI00237AA88D|nr:OmpA family protein [Dinoroseobacter sp. PD6]MDD9716722.1 OmpA family protein [Dinoroseobacter sp. PD6]
MSKRRYLPLLALSAAALASVFTARLLVEQVETRTLASVEEVLFTENAEFAQAAIDGTHVTLLGTAPDEATRFATLSAVGRVVAPDRIIDEMTVAASTRIAPPDFSLELLRNADGISLIGLVPADMDSDSLGAELAGLGPVSNMVETADFPIPGRWLGAVGYALEAAAEIPRAKISVTPQSVHISALTDSAAEKTALETRLRRTAPAGVAVTLDIAAPRPAITPFLLRFTLDDRGARFDACAAETEAGRARILAAAAETGAPRETTCVLGLGAPSQNWAEAATLGIRAVAALGGGVVTLSDADVTLVGREDTNAALFERVAAEFEADLPAVFSLTSTLPRPEAPRPGIFDPNLTRFTATLSPEGLVQLRGHVTDTIRKEVTATMAKAMFGAPNVYSATTVAEDVPEGWSVRVLAGLEALGHLHNGSVTITPEFMRIGGRTGVEDGPAEIAGLLARRLPEESDLRLDVTYDPILDPATALPTPEECYARIDAIQAEGKITFEPGSSQIAAEAEAIMDRIAQVLVDCSHVEFEIAGHTDNQGREVMNLNLSQARADAVLAALSERRILTGNLVARGYGEAMPIADNSTAEGREANRRISFTAPTPPVTSPTAETETGDPQ